MYHTCLNMKNLIKNLFFTFASLFVIFSATPVMATENTNIEEAVIIDTLSGETNESYVIDENGNQLGSLSTEVASVEVVYDGAWSGMRATNVPRTINVSVICRVTGIFSDPMYNCTLYVTLTLYYNSSTNLITSIGAYNVYNYSAPGAPQNSKNPRCSASITNGGRSVTIYGYIDYTAVYSQTFTGSTTYYL